MFDISGTDCFYGKLRGGGGDCFYCSIVEIAFK